MPTEKETAEQVVDLLVVGLAWVQEQAVERSPRNLIGWLGVGVLRAMGDIDALPMQTSRQVTDKPSTALRDYAYSRVRLEQLSGHRSGRPVLPGRPRLRELMAEGDELLLAMVHSPAYFGDLLFLPKGYKLMVTDRGREHARTVMERHGSLNRQAFLAAWGDQVRFMRNAYATSIAGGRKRR